MASDKDRHVVPSKKGGWDVVKPGAKRVSSHKDRQEEAVGRAREITGRTHGETVIHRKDGKIRAKDTARGGNDPFPPRDKH